MDILICSMETSMIIINSDQLAIICAYMAKVGSATFVKNVMPCMDQISQRVAFMEFGKVRVMRWIEDGTVRPVKSGSAVTSKIIYSRVELVAAEKEEYINKMNFEQYETGYM